VSSRTSEPLVPLALAHRGRTVLVRAFLLVVVGTVFTACRSTPAAQPATDNLRTNPWNAALADTLTTLGVADQDGREHFAEWIAANDTATIFRVMRADSARSRWLRQAVTQHGWPGRAVAGDSAVMAAWLIVQHSPFKEWQSELLPTLEQASARGDLRGQDLALLTDRILAQRGGAQRYGSQFDIVNGRLVPARIADLAGLDARRAAVGLPPMTEYVRVLSEMYKMPVVWPPPPQEK
jgi:hypothetical protein